MSVERGRVLDMKKRFLGAEKSRFLDLEKGFLNMDRRFLIIDRRFL
jgi:hypothetical protein